MKKIVLLIFLMLTGTVFGGCHTDTNIPEYEAVCNTRTESGCQSSEFGCYWVNEEDKLITIATNNYGTIPSLNGSGGFNATNGSGILSNTSAISGGVLGTEENNLKKIIVFVSCITLLLIRPLRIGMAASYCALIFFVMIDLISLPSTLLTFLLLLVVSTWFIDRG